MKLLYLPNENTEGDQYGPRSALQKLKENGDIDELQIFSYFVVKRELGNWNKTLTEFLRVIENAKPTTILIQHIGKNSFPENLWKKIKNIYEGQNFPIFVYDERDVYGVFRKPLPQAVIKLTKKCDVISLVAKGKFAERFRRMGCRNVCYLPHVADKVRFGKPWEVNQPRNYDVIMIGNNTKSKIPFRSMPGSSQRERLANLLSSKFGRRFALFGQGWQENKSNRGPLEFSLQEELMHTAWLRVGIDHFPNYEGYFSNSLPITLISGTPYVVKYIPGMENFLVDGYHCRMFDTTEEAIEITKELISGPRDKLIEMGQRGAELAQNILNEDVRMERLINILKMHEETPFRKLSQ